jgi:hypothetical protein
MQSEVSRNKIQKSKMNSAQPPTKFKTREYPELLGMAAAIEFQNKDTHDRKKVLNA